MKKNDVWFIDYCRSLSVNPEWLWNLISFESNWNPLAKNPYSSARGLIQFINSTAISLGYTSSDDLITKNPDVKSQLLFPVKAYLMAYSPFTTEQSLYMAVFYPKARKWSLSTEFPDNIKKVNPGIKTVGDYVNKVRLK